MNTLDTTTIVTDSEKKLLPRSAYLLLGHLFFSLGVIGIVLPVMPTTIFWIVAAVFYLRGSSEKYKQLIAHKRYGQTVARFVEQGAISRKDKTAASAGIALSALITLLLPIGQLATLSAMVGLLIAVLYIWSRPA